MSYTRIRRRGDLRSPYHSRWTRLTNGGAWSLVGNYTAVNVYASGSSEEMSDSNVQNFQSRRAKGEIFMNDMRLSKVSYSSSSDTFEWKPVPSESWWGAKRTGDVCAASVVRLTKPTWYTGRINDAKQHTLAKAHSKVAPSTMESLVTVVEAGKAARMVAAPFENSRTLLKKMLQRRLTLLQKGYTFVDAMKTAWLETRFGWKPILLDLENAEQAFYNNVLYDYKGPKRMVARSMYEFTWDIPGESYINTFGTPHTNKRSGKGAAKVASGVLYTLDESDVVDFARRNQGLRLADVPSSIWELVPYSFVIDRFVAVGTWLKAIVPKPGVTYLGSWTTVKEEFTEEHSITSFMGGGGAYLEYLSGGKWTAKELLVTRTANPVYVPIPWTNPRSLDLLQHIDHLALIMNELTGLRQKGLR